MTRLRRLALRPRPSPAAVLAVTVVGAAGLAIRLWVISSNLGPLDSDEAAGGLVARHFLDGEGTIFLWGNNYGGTLEAILAAPLFAVFGSGPVAWKSVMVAAYGVACLLTWRIGLRCVDPAAARLAAGLLWVASGGLVLVSTKARLYYGVSVVVTSAAILLCLRLRERRSRADVALLGLVVGLGLWTAPFCFYVLLPIVVFLFATRPSRLRDVLLAVPGGLIGASPWIVFNLRNDWPSLHERPIPVDSTYSDRLGDWFTELLPRLVGLRSYWGDWYLGPAGKMLFVGLLGAAVVLAAWCVYRRSSAVAPLVFVAVAYPFLFAIPTASFYVAEPRYGLFLAPVVALFIAAGLSRPTCLRRPAAQIGIISVAAVASIASLSSLMDWARDHPGHHDLSPPRLGRLAAVLEREGVTTVAADYWIAYALAFESEERIVASPTGTIRYRPYQERVEAAGPTAYVFFRGTTEATDLARKTAAQGIRKRTLEVDDFTAYILERPLT